MARPAPPLWSEPACCCAIPPTGDTRIALPPERLLVTSIDLREDVLMTARRFALVNDLPEVPPGQLGAAAVALAGGKVTVTVPVAATSDLEAWVYIDGGVQPVVQQVTIAKTAASGAEPLSLAAGNYRALVLVRAMRRRSRTWSPRHSGGGW